MALRRLLEKGAAALLPQKVGDVWRKAEVSAKSAARLRKQFLAEGREWTYTEQRSAPTIKDVKMKGKIADRHQHEREAKVAAGVAKQGELLAAYLKRKEQRGGTEAILDNLLLRPRERRLKARTTAEAKR